MHDFKNLQVWQKSRELVKNVYLLTANFPQSEVYGLTSQIKRCSVSIPSNIAEGSGRNSNKEFIHFLSYSHGSSCELETQLILAQDLEFLKENEVQPVLNQIDEIQKMNRSLQSSFIKRL